MADPPAGLKVPATLLPRADSVVEITDRFCAEYLDLEYADLCRRLVGRLARKRPSPLQRGDLRVWAGAVLHTISCINFLFDPSQRPHLSASELCRLLGVSQSTVTSKSRGIRDLLKLTPFDPELSRREILDQSPLRSLVDVGGLIVPADLIESMEMDEEEVAFLDSLEEADREAVELLRNALPELRGIPAPPELAGAAAEIRRRLRARDPDLRPAARANGWSARLPSDDHQLWIELAGALVAIENDTGLSSEQEALLMTLDNADLLGAVLGAVRAGTGSDASPAALAAHIDACPEVESGEVEDDDRVLIEAAFDRHVQVWQAAGALDAHLRLTELGRWGLPRALAWAWGGDFDSEQPG